MRCGTVASARLAANTRAALQMPIRSPTMAVDPIIVSLEKASGRRRGRTCADDEPTNVDGFVEPGIFDYTEDYLAEDSSSVMPGDEAPCTAPNSPQRALTVYNILASAVLVGQSRLDLDKCCSVLGNCYYCPSEFPAMRVDVRGSSSIFTISLFDAGRILATGGCRPVEAKRAMMKIARRLRERLGYSPLSLESFEIQNMLAVFDAGNPVNLRRFSATFKGGPVDYDPDRFAGARVRLLIPEATNSKAPSDTGGTTAGQKSDRVINKLRRLLVGDGGPQFSAYGPSSSAASSDRASSGSDGCGPPLYSGVGCYMMPAGARRPPPSSQKARRLLPAGATGTEESDTNSLAVDSSGGRSPSNRPEWVAANVFSTGKISLTGARAIRSFQMVLDQILPAIGFSGDSVLGAQLTPQEGVGCAATDSKAAPRK